MFCTIELPAWLVWPSIAVMLVVYFVLSLGLCCAILRGLRDGHFADSFVFFRMWPRGRADLSSISFNDRSRLLLSECIFNLGQMLGAIGLAVLSAVLTRASRISLLVWLPSPFLVLRAKVVEANLEQKSAWALFKHSPLGFFASLPDSVRGFSNGVAVVNVFIALKIYWRLPSAHTVQIGLFSGVALLQAFLVLTAVSSSLWQLGYSEVSYGMRHVGGFGMLASSLGFHSLRAETSENLTDSERTNVKLLSFVVCGLGVTYPYLWWQVAVAEAEGKGVFGDPAGTLSLLISMTLALKSGLSFVAAIAAEWRRRDHLIATVPSENLELERQVSAYIPMRFERATSVMFSVSLPDVSEPDEGKDVPNMDAGSAVAEGKWCKAIMLRALFFAEAFLAVAIPGLMFVYVARMWGCASQQGLP